MIPSETLNQEHHKDLMREARQARLAREAGDSLAISLTQRAGHALLKLGARFAIEDASACYSIDVQQRVVTVCPAPSSAS
jgi:hypothetical protein